MTNAMDREAVPEPLNPLGFDGIEFIEFATSKPQALGGVLEMMGFRPIARHRSREVELYRQGTMNVIVNAQPADVPRTVQPVERPVHSRVRRARARRECRVQARARPRRLGDPRARGADGAQHPGDPRRRRKPHLFRRPLRRVLDLRHRLSRHSLGRPPSAGRSPASTSSASSSTSAPIVPPTGSSSIRAFSASRRCRTGSASASCPRVCCCRARASKFFLQLIDPDEAAD